MLPSTALLCVTMILKGVSTLPTDDSLMTSAGGVDNSPATLSLRDKPTVSFGFYDSCPLDSSNAKWEGEDVVDYKPNVCEEVDARGDIIQVNWAAGRKAGFDRLSLYSDKECKNKFDFLFPGMSMDKIDAKYRDMACSNLTGWPKLLSVQSGNEDWGKREITQPKAKLNVRDVNPSGLSGASGIPGGSITSYPVTVDFVGHCPYTSSGSNMQEAPSLGGRVEGYIVGTCQEVDPGGTLMSINWKDGGFGNMTFYKDKNCKDEMAATVRPRWGWHDGSCFDFSKLPKLLSFKGDKTEDKGKRETIPSAAGLSMRDTTPQEPGGLYDCGVAGGCIRPDPPPLPEAVNFYDHCPYDAKGNSIEAQKTGGNVTGYIVGTCQGIDSPGPTMKINYKDGKFNTMIIYHDEHCTDKITAYDRGVLNWKTGLNLKDYGCVDLSKIPKVLSFRGLK